MRAVSYTPELRRRWDEFVATSPNATFLHRRDYMDYHADRFTDASLMVYDDKDRLVALFAANAEEQGVVCSHRGLTYGGLLVGARHFATEPMLQAWEAILAALRERGFSELVYKPVPYIYATYPSDDDLYALFRSGASLSACAISSAIPLSHPVLFNQGARQKSQRAAKEGIRVSETTHLAPFWEILAGVLRERHNTRPVHTLAEMERLRASFPHNIRLFVATDPQGTLLGGTLIYFTQAVAHAQYIAITEAGRRSGALAALVAHIVEHHCQGLAYFDFGTSCEQHGLVLNASLCEQKYGMGGRPVAYTEWTLKL